MARLHINMHYVVPTNSRWVVEPRYMHFLLSPEDQSRVLTSLSPAIALHLAPLETLWQEGSSKVHLAMINRQ